MVTGESNKLQEVNLTDQDTAQKITFPTTLKNVQKLQLKISEIYKGQKYKDVLLSELRFVSPLGDVILPIATIIRPKVPKFLSQYLDRSFSSYYCGTGTRNVTAINSFKIRSDGTFTVFNFFEKGGGGECETCEAGDAPESRVLEGNWDVAGDKIRIFGKRYVRRMDSWAADYGQKEMVSEPEIFQSELTMKSMKEFKANEQQKIAGLVWGTKADTYNPSSKPDFSLRFSGGTVQAKTLNEMKSKLIEKLLKENTLIVESSAFSDAFILSDNKDSCVNSD